VSGMRSCEFEWLGTSCPPNRLSDYGWMWAASLGFFNAKQAV